MTRKSTYRLGMPGDFRISEAIPLKGLYFKVAHIEEGILVLALDGFTKAGVDALAKLKLQYDKAQEETNKATQDDLP